MELDNTHQISQEQLQLQHFDVFIAVSGYESRCTYLAGKLNLTEIPVKIVFSVDDASNSPLQNQNDQTFLQWGFEFVKAIAKESSTIEYILNRICSNSTNKHLNILVDYSSMPKTWYFAIINFFIAYEDRIRKANLWFAYAPSEFYKSNEHQVIKTFEPFPPKYANNKPVALIVGLGYEKSRSGDLSKQINAKVTFAYYADPAFDERFVKEVLDNNQLLLDDMHGDQIIKYPIFDLNSINDSLTKLCVNLRPNYQVILAPIGPKPFTLMSFLLATRYPDMKVWKVMTDERSSPFDRKPLGELLVYKVIFTSEEVDY